MTVLDCQYQLVRWLFLGVSSTGKDVGRFCSNLTNNVKPQVAVPVNQMWLAFVSDASIQHEGFNITYQFARKYQYQFERSSQWQLQILRHDQALLIFSLTYVAT